ncbi:hypothetical protein INT46_004397 [Mucor plumbeus]|uniref:Tethering factor for nuclear proteasome STS1 n=1 Tax=Mucor plumbeus TaxID=97098 RepID=A0A8H7RCW1_9FUNG|nr:hypothetical protein INT46_004397 [Mucor plumbeus]
MNSYQQELTRGRKRRNSEDEEMADALTIKPATVRRSFKCVKLSENSKRNQKRSTRGALLDTLEKDALINIINSLLNTQPQVRQDIMNNIPAPTILSTMNVLIDMERKFNNSFPFNKNGPGKDDYTFSRVRDGLSDLIDTITQYANHFTSAQVFPTTCFTFLDHATQMAHRLPTWDNEDNNKLKRDLYQDLNDFWKLAIQTTSSNLRQGECYSPESVGDWAKSLAQHNSFTNGYFTEAVHDFTRQLGFMIGLPASNEIAEVTNVTSASPICHLAPLESTLTSASVVGARR